MTNVNQLLRNSPLEEGIGEKIFCHLFNIPREKLFVERDRLELSDDILKKFKKIEGQILAGTPPQYCLNSAEFYGREFYVDKNILIPRPETEILINLAINHINALFFRSEKKCNKQNIVDIGTGSGCIAISLACELNLHPTPNTLRPTYFFATDVSEKALGIAKRNAKTHNTNINFLKSDLFANPKLPKKFDLICANLPYLESDYLKKLPKKLANNLKFEPELALDGGRDGLELIKKLIIQLPDRLARDGLTILEIDPGQKTALLDFCKKNLVGCNFEIIKDLAKRNRFLAIE